MKDLVFTSDKGNPITSSKLVAQKFDKNHYDVLKAIRNLECSEDFQKRNFAVSLETRQLPNGGVKDYPYCIMTRDGFSFLAMGFTGKKAATFKEDFINAFNKMEAVLKQKQASLPQDYLSALKALVQSEEQRQADQKRIATLEPKAQFMDRVMDTESNIDIGQAAKVLDLPFGRNTMFKKLREQGVFFKNRNEPKQEYIKRGYFLLKEKLIERDNHESFVVLKVLATQKGLEFINRLFGAQLIQKKLPKIQ
jgi:Rha family phage regulatory protein